LNNLPSQAHFGKGRDLPWRLENHEVYLQLYDEEVSFLQNFKMRAYEGHEAFKIKTSELRKRSMGKKPLPLGDSVVKFLLIMLFPALHFNNKKSKKNQKIERNGGEEESEEDNLGREERDKASRQESILFLRQINAVP